METIKDIRKEKGLTQREAAQYAGIPLRTYKNYENDDSKFGNIKYNYILQKLLEYGYVDEEHGILSEEDISSRCREIFEKYEVRYAILFGSYAKGIATERSDVDILVSTDIGGIKFFALTEELRVALKKRVDLLDFNQLNGNNDLLNDILKDGVRIYG